MSLCTRYRSLLCGLLRRSQYNKCFPGSRLLSDKAGGPEDREYVPAGSHAKSNVFSDEIKSLFFGIENDLECPRQTDILIIGGGLVGTAVAFFLKRHSRKMMDVTIIERDYAYTRASSMLSAGGVRHQFTLPENVQMSMFTTEFLQDCREHLSVLAQETPSVDFHHQGYLFLATQEKADLLEQCVNMQRELGAKTVMLSRSMLEDKYPWLNLDGVECGSFGTSGEGWFDPWQLLHAIKAKNVNQGVQYCQGDVVKFRYRNDGAGIERIQGVDVDAKDGKRYGVDTAVVINCAGPWAGEIANLAGVGSGNHNLNMVPLPVEPRKRFVYMVHCPDGPTLDCPFLVDTSGAYFRREGYGGHYICGSSPPEDKEPDILDLGVDYDFYNDYVWPTIAHRVPAFNNSKLKSAWAGYYDYNTLDQNLIIGSHPYYSNLLFANGMSGHGVQQALAIGRAIYELIVMGHYVTIDLTRFEFDRVVSNIPVKEQAIV